MLKIYRIIDNTNGNIYIGRTKQTLNIRLSGHKCDKTCSSREIIKNGDYKIELIEETDDESRERYWIEHTECVNKIIPGRTRKEWKDANKQYYKKYNKNYYQNNKENRNNKNRINANWYSSMGGSPYKNNSSLLKIDPNLFLI